ncbi:sulfotransferase family protein [Ruegeria sp. 2012CJ41-6]|uniref:Sulfotransferase family protein n=1 Tax=Ruegeria spongiae TaxID=2942209 RepID=A0ABT0Q2N5_9RHOB|nr:sulfotransferase family 2 domain-containing protein [Ruegeria spongiae]MCL6284062.1 sulfotransferase family protein [Ruegeria spongiae]
MIISRGRSYIFVHIPKTGGTSLALALESRAKKDDILIGDTPKARRRRHRQQSLPARGRLWKHATLRDIDGVVSDDELEDFFVFTLVRNPWDRAVSYYHWLREQRFDHPTVTLAKRLQFEAFVLHSDTLAAFRSHPYTSYMRDAAGVDRSNLYIRIEHFEADATALWQHLGFEVVMPHVNRSERLADYRRYYSPPMIDAIAKVCAVDIHKFNYRFE